MCDEEEVITWQDRHRRRHSRRSYTCCWQTWWSCCCCCCCFSAFLLHSEYQAHERPSLGVQILRTVFIKYSMSITYTIYAATDLIEYFFKSSQLDHRCLSYQLKKRTGFATFAGSSDPNCAGERRQKQKKSKRCCRALLQNALAGATNHDLFIMQHWALHTSSVANIMLWIKKRIIMNKNEWTNENELVYS